MKVFFCWDSSEILCSCLLRILQYHVILLLPDLSIDLPASLCRPRLASSFASQAPAELGYIDAHRLCEICEWSQSHKDYIVAERETSNCAFTQCNKYYIYYAKIYFIENNSVIYSSWSVFQGSWTKAKLLTDTEYQTGKVVSNFYYHVKWTIFSEH